ncbi:MAG: prepilin peptidase [Gemmatimonadales bacterium]|nr:prepilin peptidase [Gemmatimonadales bacterium]
MSGAAPTIVFVALVGAAGIIDARTRRIPNPLTLSLLLAGLLLRAWEGLLPFVDGVLGALGAVVLSLLLFRVGALGGGDGKLLIGIGAFLGWQRLPGALLMIGVLGGFLGIAEAVRRGVIVPALLNAGRMIRFWLTLGREGERRTLTSPGAVAVPYGLAIALGAIVWWFWGG